ncbi:MAG: hypothetical protein RH862_06955 [Leptospiraceae bacterium]
MCSLCLIISAVVVSLLAFLSYQIQTHYRWSLTSVQEKSAGLIHFYRSHIHRVFRDGDLSRIPLECTIHYFLMHLLVPLIFFGFFLRSDINFLGVAAGILTSLQLLKHIYPGQL